MELQQQVTSLELSKKLKVLGVKQDGYYVYSKIMDFVEILQRSTGIAEFGEVIASAFTVAELGELLPQNFDDDGKNWTWSSYLSINGWNVSYETMDEEGLYEVSALKEADARAKMLIYLLENMLIDPKESAG